MKRILPFISTRLILFCLLTFYPSQAAAWTNDGKWENGATIEVVLNGSFNPEVGLPIAFDAGFKIITAAPALSLNMYQDPDAGYPFRWDAMPPHEWIPQYQDGKIIAGFMTEEDVSAICGSHTFGCTRVKLRGGDIVAAVMVFKNSPGSGRSGLPSISDVEKNPESYHEVYFWGIFAHEMIHALGADSSHTTGMSIMMPAAEWGPPQKLWAEDTRSLLNMYDSNPPSGSYRNVYISNWEADSDHINPCEVSSADDEPVSLEFVLGNDGRTDLTNVEVNIVAVNRYTVFENVLLKSLMMDSLNAGESLRFEESVSLLDVPFADFYVIVAADPYNVIFENNELDNGPEWPRIHKVWYPIEGGWLYLESGSDYGGDYNEVRLTQDENGPPRQAQLAFSTQPYPDSDAQKDAWFAQATPVPLPDIEDPFSYDSNHQLYVTLNLQNDQIYHVALREIRNGQSEWEYRPPDGGFEVKDISTYACAMQVMYPNGNESFFKDDPVAIQWNRPGRCMASAKLELFRNSSLCSTIDAQTANTGNFIWSAGQCNGQSGGYKVKVADILTGASDFSDAAFSIPLATYQVRNPSLEWDYGTNFFSGYSGDNNISGDDLPDGWEQSSWPGVRDSAFPHTGAYSLKIPKTQNNGQPAFAAQDLPVTYGRAYRASGYVRTDCLDSDCFGTIVPQCLDANHDAVSGSCSLDVDPWSLVKFTGDHDWGEISYLLKDDHSAAQYLRVNCANSFYGGPYPPPDGTGTVWCDDVRVEDLGAVTVTSPNGGENFVEGSPMNINWIKASGGQYAPTVKIELLITRDMTDSPCMTIDSSAANTGSYTWNSVQRCNEPYSTYKIRITDNTYPILSDKSNATFVIQEQCRLGFIQPQPYETLYNDWHYNIQWAKTGACGTTQVLLIKNDIPCSSIAGGITGTSFNWSVGRCGGTSSDSYKLELSDYPSGAVFRMRNPFLILNPPYPEGGQGGKDPLPLEGGGGM